MQGEVHAFLAVHDDGGKLLGYADEVNVQVGRTWRSRLTVRFLDGSVSDETATYTQGGTLKLLTDHLVEKGPSFPKPVDLVIDTVKDQVTYHEEKDGKDEVKTDAMNLPADLSNGIVPLVLQNVPRGVQESKVSYMVTTPKPRVVKLAIHPDGQGSYKVGTARSATHLRLHVEIGGVEGVIAPLVGKEPPDMDAWVSSGAAPTLLKLRIFLFVGGPLWTLQLASPEWEGERLTRASATGAQ